MSGYARVAHALGARVSGSDRVMTPYAERLRAEAVLDAIVGHAPENLPDSDDAEVVYSSAIPPDSPERAAARARGLRERSRGELLGELSSLKRTIAVAGTHGKTTTASMLAWALRGAGLKPSWLIGAEIGDSLPNSHWAGGDWLVIEADESDRSMLELHADIVVLTNVELDHADAYGSLAELRDAFGALLARAPHAVVWDRPELLSLRAGPVIAFDALGVTLEPTATRFRWRAHDVTLAVLGAHNAIDASGALEAARLAGAPERDAVAALASFHGAARRCQLMGRTGRGALVYDDYAHHPTEVAATLAAARVLVEPRQPPGRLVAVFQPHLFSRTRALADGLGRALAGADVAVVLGVYPARERAADHPGVSGLLVASAAAHAARGRPVYWLPAFDDAEPVLQKLLARGDVCVVMGAGDADTLARRLVGATRPASAPTAR